MTASCTTVENPDTGVVLRQLDDQCFVEFGDRHVDSSRTRAIGEKLRNLAEHGRCRKLVISLEGAANISSFLTDRFAGAPRAEQAQAPADALTPGSDFWVG